MALAIAQTQQTPSYEPRGGARALLLCRDREVLLDGPANTGKSFAGLWKLHIAACKYAGMHGLLLRKTFVSLKASTLVTFRERIIGQSSPVHFWGARAEEAAHYAYPNGSKLYVGGMDNAAKIMSTEYDMVMWDEATDGELGEWEALQTRLRYGRMPYQQAIACVNPQGPSHWLNLRANEGKITRIYSRHDDNPTVTPDYLKTLDGLTGVRRARLYLGLWQAAEGGIYEDDWNPAIHLIDRFPIPAEWPRYLSIDFGYTHPAVVQWWAQDNDGRLYRYRELYRTHTLVQDLAAIIRQASTWGEKHGEPMPRAVIADPEDAEGRAQLARHLGIYTEPANKAVQQGIQAVQARLRIAGDGKPRIFLLRDSLLGDRDPLLREHRLPCCTEEEIDGYVWDTRAGQRRGEQPMKENDHGCDAMRYAVAYHDLPTNGVSYGKIIY